MLSLQFCLILIPSFAQISLFLHKIPVDGSWPNATNQIVFLSGVNMPKSRLTNGLVN